MAHLVRYQTGGDAETKARDAALCLHQMLSPETSEAVREHIVAHGLPSRGHNQWYLDDSRRYWMSISLDGMQGIIGCFNPGDDRYVKAVIEQLEKNLSLAPAA